MNLGEKIIDFNLFGVDGSYFSVSNIDNEKKIVVFFTCNHCPYVHAYEKRIMNLQNKYAESVQFIGINSNDDKKYPEDSFEKMKERSNIRGYNFPYLHDTDQKIAKLYDASHTPHFFVFSKKILIYKGKFDDNWSDKSKVAKTYLEYSIKNTSFNPQDTFPVGCTIKWR